MDRRFRLPMFPANEDGDQELPKVTQIRQRLGGRRASNDGDLAGTWVQLPHLDNAWGVIVSSPSEHHAFVWITEGLIRKVERSRLLFPTTRPNAHPLERISYDCKQFAMLVENDLVHYLNNQGEIQQGTLVELCHFGAVILRNDDVLMGVGFRRIWKSHQTMN
jgi:hypothetical protein